MSLRNLKIKYKNLTLARYWLTGIKNFIFGLIFVFIFNILPLYRVEAIPPKTLKAQNPIHQLGVGFKEYSLHALIQQGKELYQTSRFNEAIAIWQQALNREKAQGNQLTQAMLLNHLSLAYQQLGQWQQAETAIASSI
jgi:tetratricopeptide (TPR) repeat protein